MIEHPPPTIATAKSLYARAFRCAYPECPEPLYREDELTGTWTLNSRICHICARSEGGPRWDARQSGEENRSEANLVLMCQAHASAIDDPNSVIAYTPKLLRKWKASQIAEHKQLREGWPLTRTMAKEALTASFSNVSIAMNNSVVNLVGEGGRGPGSGGGGGPAFGPYSRGGRGGNGGRMTDFDGNPLSEEALAKFQIDAGSETPPGSGGGGAGAFGPGALGGDGGSGGDGLMGILAVEEGDIVEFDLGKGGESPRLPGQHGHTAGDTVMIVRSADGAVKRVLRARGGAGAKSGELPDDWVTISQADLLGGFQITTLCTANAVELRDGLLFVLGGGWSTFYTVSLPFDAIWTIICAAAWTRLDHGPVRGLQICVSDSDGREVSRLALSLPPTAANGHSYNWVQNIGAPLDRGGIWRVSVQSGDFLLSEIKIDVKIHSE